jgi:hypothetical protein
MPGRALEIALATGDIRQSFDYWSRLGFGSALTADTWTHPYGVMTAPGLNLGLHGIASAPPVLHLVRPDIAGLVPLLEERGVEPDALRLGAEVFNELRFVDPAGLAVRVLEARTFSPPPVLSPPLPGRFDSLSWPCADPEGVARFWQRLHVDTEARPDDWALLRADVGGQGIAWHSPRICAEPLLVFRHPHLGELRARLGERELQPAKELGFAAPHLALTSPERQKLAILA